MFRRFRAMPYRLNTQSIRRWISASDRRGVDGGMSTPPVTFVQLPLPPFLTVSIKALRARALFLYFAAMSWNAGPIPFWSTLWHSRHPLFLASASSAIAVPAHMIISPAAGMLIQRAFIPSSTRTVPVTSRSPIRRTDATRGGLGVLRLDLIEQRARRRDDALRAARLPLRVYENRQSTPVTRFVELKTNRGGSLGSVAVAKRCFR